MCRGVILHLRQPAPHTTLDLSYGVVQRRLAHTKKRWREGMIRVLIADDHPLVRAGLRQLLGDDPNIGEIGEAGSGNETLQKLREGGWNLLLLDINMPDRNGLDILRNVNSAYPETRVLVLSGFSER